MIKNYFKIAWRNLLKNKSFSIINVSGLAIGMASAILILMWVQNEISYDRFHLHRDRLYEVFSNDVINNSIRTVTYTPEIMAPGLRNDLPEVEQATRVAWQQYHVLAFGDKSLKPQGAMVDPAFLGMFTFALKSGNAANALNDPHSILLTEQLAKRMFGNEDAVGKVIQFDRDESLKVTGILKDVPNNTLFNFEYLTSYEYRNSQHDIDSDWTDISISTFVLLKQHSSFEAANQQIKNVIVQHSGGNAKTAEFLYPVSKLRLYSNFENGIAVGGRIKTVKIFLIIAVFILLIACINFMNLSTARSEKRGKEVGVRKVAGAGKRSLILQFLAESIFTSLIVGILACMLVQLCLPEFNRLFRKSC